MQSLLDQSFAEAERFQAQPIEQQLSLNINEHNIGYIPMRGATTRVNAVRDMALPNANEAVFFKRDQVHFCGQNEWPERLKSRIASERT